MNGGTEVFTPLDSLRRLVGRSGGLALHHRIGLDHFQHDGRRQVDPDRVAFHQVDGHAHVVLQERGRIAQQLERDVGLLVALRVHQHHVGAVGVGVVVLLLLGHQPLDRVGGAPALVGLVAGLEVAHFHLDEGAAFAGSDDLLLQHRPATAFVLDHLSGANQVRLLLHRKSLCRLIWGCRLLDRPAGRASLCRLSRGSRT